MAVHVRTFYKEEADFDQQVEDWLNSLPQPLDVDMQFSAQSHITVIAREAESPRAAAALLAAQVLIAAAPSDPSPDGTLADDVQDNNGGHWTIGSGNATLRNRIQAAGGIGSEYLFINGKLYAHGLDLNWYWWHDDSLSFTNVGATQPTS